MDLILVPTPIITEGASIHRDSVTWLSETMMVFPDSQASEADTAVSGTFTMNGWSMLSQSNWIIPSGST